MRKSHNEKYYYFYDWVKMFKSSKIHLVKKNIRIERKMKKIEILILIF